MAKKKRVNTEQVRIQNAAKSLVANIRFASIDNQVRSLAVTSSVPNEGKTTVAIALAQAMASLGERVLLVECDMRRRSLANVLGAHSRGGLYSVVCGQMDLEEAVATTTRQGSPRSRWSVLPDMERAKRETARQRVLNCAPKLGRINKAVVS